jgi:2-isopropylmalate synthase
MNSERQIKIFDTTLRDGQQCPGAGMSFEHNLEYAQLAYEVGVDVIEAGFPSASQLDFEIFQTIAAQLASHQDSPMITGLCQLRDEQVDRTIEALFPAVKHKKGRLHVYVPVDPELMVASLGQERAANKEQIIKDVFEFVSRSVKAGLEVEFSPEGYSRMGDNFNFVTELIEAAVQAGGSVINCPDTIGGASEFQGEEYFVNLMNRHAEIISAKYPTKQVTWSTHCHNDLGLATQNSLNAVFRGPARQIEGCFNGVGERAGNVALEQCIMVINTYGNSIDSENPFYTNIKLEKLQKICDFVSKHMLPRQPHWPITGDNSAKHSSGGHTNAILRNPLAYQPFDPREIGKPISFLFGPLSGGNHAKSIIEEAGYVCEDSEKSEIAQFIKDLYHERRKGITDQELLRGYFEYRKPIRATSFDYSRSSNRSSVQLVGKFFDKQGEINEVHQGPDSALAALKGAIDKKFGPFEIQNHRSNSDSQGINAKSVSNILISYNGQGVFEGEGVDQDIEISAMKALINAVNVAFIETNFKRA